MPSNLPKTITGNPGFGLDVKKDSFHLQSLPSILLLTGDGRHTTLLGSHSSGCLSYSLSSSFPTHPVILPECTGRWTWLGALVDVSNRPGFKRARSASGRSVSLFGYIYIYTHPSFRSLMSSSTLHAWLIAPPGSPAPGAPARRRSRRRPPRATGTRRPRGSGAEGPALRRSRPRSFASAIVVKVVKMVR